MDKFLYYLECTAINDIKFPNVSLKAGDKLYFNGNASSKEMYIWVHNRNIQDPDVHERVMKYRYMCNRQSYLPFTRLQKNAKKWQILKYAEDQKDCIESTGDFKCEIKTIKLIVNYID